MPPSKGSHPVASVPTRIPAHLLEGVDAYVAKIEKKNPGLTLARAEAVRILLREGLGAMGIKVRNPKKGPR